MKKGYNECPFCGEEIKEGAIKCRYCGEFLEKNVENENLKKNQSGDNKNGLAGWEIALIIIAGIVYTLLWLLFSGIFSPVKEKDGYNTIQYEGVSEIDKCEELIKIKDNIFSDYVFYYGGMLSGSQSMKMDDRIYGYIIDDLWDHQLSFSRNYLGTMVGVSNEYNPMNSGSLDAPSFCSNEQTYRVKKYDDMYIKFYYCLINTEGNKNYMDINLLECSANLSELYLGEIMNIYYSDKI